MIYNTMDYIPFDINNPYCLHVILSKRAYCSIINETFEHGYNETGGLLMGYIIGRKWYVVEVIDPGTNNTIHQTGLFQWDQDYVNQMADRLRIVYRYQPTILGFWHRHPGSMDFFSQQDVESTQKNLQNAKKGLISMLVNIDPALRMTFYYCNGPHFMPVRYDVGDEYFPVELLEYASPETISKRHTENQYGQAVDISYRRILQPPTAPGKKPNYSVRADNDISDTEPPTSVPAPTPEPAPIPEPAPTSEPAPVPESPTQPSSPKVPEDLSELAESIPFDVQTPEPVSDEPKEEACGCDENPDTQGDENPDTDEDGEDSLGEESETTEADAQFEKKNGFPF